MIFYFTGTGNSLYAAARLAHATADRVVSIAECMQQETFSFPEPCERVGFVFPVYWYGLPVIVERFLDRLALGGCDYVYAVVTCGGSAGGTVDALRARLQARGDGAVRRVFGADARQLHPAFFAAEGRKARRRCSRRPSRAAGTPLPPPSRRSGVHSTSFPAPSSRCPACCTAITSPTAASASSAPTTAARLRPLCGALPRADDFARLRPPGLAGGMHPLSGLPPPLSRRRDTVRPRYGKAGAVCQPQGDVLSGCTSHIVYI